MTVHRASSFVFIIALLFVADIASSQPLRTDPSMTAVRAARATPLPALFGRPFVGVEVSGIDAPEKVEVGEEVRFTAITNIRNVTLPAETTWKFGDGETRRGLSTTHVFERPGRYTVAFSMSNSGSADGATVQVEVLEAEEPSAENP